VTAIKLVHTEIKVRVVEKSRSQRLTTAGLLACGNEKLIRINTVKSPEKRKQVEVTET